MYSDETTQAFRKSYRGAISPKYNGYAHMVFVVVAGVGFISYKIGGINEFGWIHFISILATVVAWNFVEYFIHIKLGHQKRKLAAMFYKRHTGDHHSFFTEKRLVPMNHRDWRVTLFPAWLVVVTAVIATGIGLSVGYFLGEGIGDSAAAGLMIGYLAYEFFHFCDHLPQNHFLVKLPWIGHMRHLHKLHHRRDLMHTKNFNLTFPLADWLFGTFYWVPLNECEPEIEN